MPPILASLDVVDRRMCYAESLSDLASRECASVKQLPDFSHLVTVQFGCVDSHAGWLSAFAQLIKIVVRMRAQKQMSRVHTRWVITRMANIHAFGDVSEVHPPRHAMCQFLPNRLNSAVAANAISLPRPTVIRPSDGNALPEPLFNGEDIAQAEACLRAKTAASVRWAAWNRLAALQACSLFGGRIILHLRLLGSRCHGAGLFKQSRLYSCLGILP